jgi:hypothetical protein
MQGSSSFQRKNQNDGLAAAQNSIASHLCEMNLFNSLAFIHTGFSLFNCRHTVPRNHWKRVHEQERPGRITSFWGVV